MSAPALANLGAAAMPSAASSEIDGHPVGRYLAAPYRGATSSGVPLPLRRASCLAAGEERRGSPASPHPLSRPLVIALARLRIMSVGLLDRVELGLTAVFSGCGDDPVGDARERLLRVGVRFEGALPLHVDAVLDVPGWPGAPVTIRLSLSPGGPGELVVRNTSKAAMNPMRALRGWLGSPACGERGLDGGLNVVGPTLDRTAEFRELQRAFLRNAISELDGLVTAALPEAWATDVRDQQVWLRACDLDAKNTAE